MNLGRILDNDTLFVAQPWRAEDRHGRAVLVVIMKVTYEVSPRGVVTFADPPSPIRQRPTPVTSQRHSSLRYPSDLVVEKPGTDVLLVGTAQPPADRPATEMDVSVRVVGRFGTLYKSARVTGPRVWYQGVTGVVAGRPAKLEPTPLVYELAYGGHDESDPDRPLVDDRNPAGSGVVRDLRRLVGQPAPQIEDPRAPCTGRRPAPIGFGPIPADWEPRMRYAGTYDELWLKTRAPVPPADFDPRHNSCASPELWSETPLSGDEAVEVLGATAHDGPPGASAAANGGNGNHGAWRFRLPCYTPVVESILLGEARPCATHLDTFLIDADARRVELVWRTAVALPRKSEQLEVVRIQAIADDAASEMMARALCERLVGT